jgi:protoporphyrinogen oxidase
MPKVIVVGGGIAGLGAAYRLKGRGFDVEVLESEDTPGGRMRSERHGGFVIERGAQFIASSYKHMRRLAAELGLENEIEKLSNTRNAVLRRLLSSATARSWTSTVRRRPGSWTTKAPLTTSTGRSAKRYWTT